MYENQSVHGWFSRSKGVVHLGEVIGATCSLPSTVKQFGVLRNTQPMPPWLLGVPGSHVMFVLSRCNCTNAFLFPCAQTLLQYDRPNHRQKQGPQTIHYKPIHWSFILYWFFFTKEQFFHQLNGGHRRVHQVGVSTRVLCVQWPCQWHQWSSSRGPQGQKNLF